MGVDIGNNSNDEYLLGTKGDDVLDGGLGDDVIVGGRGDDILTGGLGSDEFIYSRKEGSDTITDFEIGIDEFTLIGKVSAVSSYEAYVDGDGILDTVFEMSNGETLTFLGLNGIDADDIFG